MSNVIDIHIQRNIVGTVIPFDKVYLFDRADRELIPKIFGYAIVLPFSDDMRDVLYKLKVAEVTHKRFQRDDSSKKVEPLLDGESLDSKTDIRAWWDAFALQHDLQNRVAVVPVLTSVARKKIRPRYISSHKWFTDQQKRGKSSRPLPVVQAISELGYLATPLAAPQDKIRPICSICPRMLMHLQGECIPGQAVCYKSLDFSEIEEAPADVSLQQDHD